MSERFIDLKETPSTHQLSREEIDAALARLEKIAASMPPVDAVELVREGRSVANDIS